jgi:hypothetical protein
VTAMPFSHPPAADRGPTLAMNSVPRRVAIAIWTVTIAIPAAIMLLVLTHPQPGEGAWAIPLYWTLVASWGLMGALLVTRRPGNRVGLVLWTVGLGMGLALIGQLWAAASVLWYDGTLPGTRIGTVLGLLFQPALFLVMLVPLLFPDGRFMSRRWAFVGALLLASAVATLLGSLMQPGPIEGMPGFDNPLGVPALADLSQALIEAGGLGALVCLPVGIVAAVVRYRRGTRLARTQLKWFGSVLVLAFSMFLLAALLPDPYGQAAWIVASLSLGLIPVAIANAILRYRLYEIDRIISRSIGWAIVTGSLIVVFGLGLVAMQAVLVGVTGGETVAVGASTLAAFALFQPLRRRVQSAVDHRFDRGRYDATLTAGAFADRLRDQVDLAELESDVVATVAAVLRPAAVGIWIRTAGIDR